MLSAMPARSSAWAKTLFAVTIRAGPWEARIRRATLALRNSVRVSTPDSLAWRASSVAGSIPSTVMPASLKKRRNVPSLLPTSTTSTPGSGRSRSRRVCACSPKCRTIPAEVPLAYV